MPDIMTTGLPCADLEFLAAKANNYMARARAVSTVRAYQSDWHDFAQWAKAQQLESLPASPQTVALYLTDRASTLAAGTLTRRLTSISRQHVHAGLTSPASTRIPVVGECANNGVPEYVIMRQTGHTSRQMLDRYIRMGQLFTHNASAGLGI